jgi:thioredoxin-disulfide reductase
MIAPVFEALAKEYGDRAYFAKVNIRTNPTSSAAFAVEGLPNFKFVLKGKVIEQMRGASEEGLQHYIKKAIETADNTDITITQEEMLTFFQEHDKEVAASPESLNMLMTTGAKSWPRLLDLLRKQYGAVPKYTGGFIRAVSPEPLYEAGAKVQVFGLQSAAAQKFNGAEGTLLQKLENGRWEVKLGRDVKALKVENFKILSDTTAAVAESRPQNLVPAPDSAAIEENQADEQTSISINPCSLFRRRSGVVERVTVIGGGPAGLSAALYAGRANLCPLVIAPWGSSFGGQLAGKGVDVENYPGLPATTGVQMVSAMREQVKDFNAELRDDTVVSVDLSRRPFTIRTNSSGELKTETLIIATGARSRWLGVPGEWELRGHGVSGCATCDGYLHQGKRCLVVGGGDAALEDALHLKRICTSVTLVHRSQTFRAGGGVQARVLDDANIAVRKDSRVLEFRGTPQSGLVQVVVEHIPSGAKSELAVEAAFIAIGHDPDTAMFKDQLAMDSNGYLELEGRTTHTSVDGVFAAGDVADHRYRQAVTSAGAGAAAALDAERHLAGTGTSGMSKCVRPEDFSDWSIVDLRQEIDAVGLKCPGCKEAGDFIAALRKSF